MKLTEWGKTPRERGDGGKGDGGEKRYLAPRKQTAGAAVRSHPPPRPRRAPRAYASPIKSNYPRCLELPFVQAGYLGASRSTRDPRLLT